MRSGEFVQVRYCNTLEYKGYPPHPLQPIDIGMVEFKDVKDLNRFVKDHFIEGMGGKCVICGAKKEYRTQLRSKRGSGTYRKIYLVEVCNLEFDHYPPIHNADYMYRIGRLNFGGLTGIKKQEYFNLFFNECNRCILKCIGCHERGRF
jgi:hypothetical protein